MKSIKTLIILLAITMVSCDNNDDATAALTTDGFTIDATFYETVNAYITIDQSDSNADGYPDHYNFMFSDGRITDAFGSTYAYSVDNTSRLALIKVLANVNPSLTTNTISAGETYIGSSYSTGSPDFSADSIIVYDAMVSGSSGTENGVTYGNLLETNGVWHYVGPVVPSVTINAINIDYNTPTNSTVDIDYTFLDTDGISIIGHYEGTLGIILD